MTSTRYVIVCPVRNEQEYLEQTIESVVGQTIQPAAFIIVDDGSTDSTGRLIDEASRQHKWISGVHQADRGTRRAGAGVMEAFHAGLRQLKVNDWDFLVKLDGDVTFQPDYFRRCFERFELEPSLGIGGGTIGNTSNGVFAPESGDDPWFHVRGATKIYKRRCWEAIGGLVQATGWDTVDEIKANSLGWTTRTFPDIHILHHRPAGAAYGTWSNWVKNGRANYFTGYHPLFMLVKAATRLFKPPYLAGAAGLMAGFLGGYLRRAPQVHDPGMIRYLRQQQLRRLTGRANLWRPADPVIDHQRRALEA